MLGLAALSETPLSALITISGESFTVTVESVIVSVLVD